MNLERTISLLGKEKMDKIISSNILIVGIGGVGGYTLESLVRMGINNITIVDYDTIDETNINRQILSNLTNINNYKVDVALKRYSLINDNLKLNIIKEKLDSNNIDKLLTGNYDYIVDACDDVKAKIALIKYAFNNKTKIITCTGTAKRIDGTKLKVTTLDKTKNDPLAKKLRSELRKENISLKIKCIVSEETPVEVDSLGSISYVPGIAGLLITSEIINDLIK